MPNVTIQGPIDLRQIIIRRPEMFLRDPDGIKRVSEYYINTECTKLLLEALVIEPDKKQQFFIQVCKKSSGAIVRLEPISQVEKTVGGQAPHGTSRVCHPFTFPRRALCENKHRRASARQ